jgi:hypothetical protein
VPYIYRVKWRKNPKQYITVEAWPRHRELTLPEEKNKPSFTIGKLEGTRTIMLWQFINDLQKRYKIKKKNGLMRIDLPPDDINAIAEAYRLGLAAAALSHLENQEAAEHTLRYITRSTKEEIWFWASKYLSVIDDGIPANKVVKALCILST